MSGTKESINKLNFDERHDAKNKTLNTYQGISDHKDNSILVVLEDDNEFQKSKKLISNTENNKLHPIAMRIADALAYKSRKSETKLSWNGLAQALNLSPGAPTNWKKGKISNDTLEKIAEFTGVDFAWLVTGEGQMLKDTQANPLPLLIAAAACASGGTGFMGITASIIAEGVLGAFGNQTNSTKLQKVINELKEDPDIVEEIKQDVEEAVEKTLTEKFNNVSEKIETQGRLVPIISLVAAGGFKEAILSAKDGYITSYLETLSPDAFCLEIEGMSMAPDFLPGDRIVCDPNVSPYPGDCVIAQKTENGETEATFKKYKPRGFDETGREYFELVPINPDYPIMTSKYQDIDIIATVIEHFRTLRRPRAQ